VALCTHTQMLGEIVAHAHGLPCAKTLGSL